MLHIGVDMHKRFSQVAVLDDSGRIQQERRLEHHDRQKLAEFFGQFAGEAVVTVEATRNWYWLADLIESLNVQVKLAHPFGVRLIASNKLKTDKVDARALAQLERTDFLPESYIAPRDVRNQREWLRYRTNLVHDRSCYKARIHAVLDKLGISHDYTDLFGVRGLEFLKTLELPDAFQHELNGYLELIAFLDAKIVAATKHIRGILRKDPRAARLMSIPGVGEIIAHLLLSEIGDISRFCSAKKLCGYAGLVPLVRQSADHIWGGRITHQGDRYIRWGMVEASYLAPRKDPALHTFYRRLAHRRGPQKAHVAVARKLLVAVWRVLTYEQDYRYNCLSKLSRPGKPESVSGRA